jgi:UDP-N-acetylmuramoyl-tripeptide--D-alanyl-D-alanine ligase
MTELWTWDAVIAAAEARLEGSPTGAITGFSIDTRSIQSGEVFVALTDTRDGHAFVSAAFKAGAIGALVRTDYQRQAQDGALLRVDDPLRALERIAAAARKRLPANARVIAVTGSAGKTGTKEMLRACLLPFGKTHAPEKSFNNHWGVPLTLARMPADTRYAVIEIGMNHAGEITPLSQLTRPHLAVITNVLPVHVGHFPDGEIGIAHAKAEIFAGLDQGGTAILPRDNPHFERLATAAGTARATVIGFGSDPRSSVRAIEVHGTDAGSEIVLASTCRGIRFTVGAPGKHLAANALAVAAVLETLGISLDAGLRPLAYVTAPTGRGAQTLIPYAGGEILLIDESYNANPASMRAALAVLAGVPREKFTRRIAVLGDMRELGTDAALLHRQLKDAVDASGADLVLACGEHMHGLYGLLEHRKQGTWAATSIDLVTALRAALKSGDVVMVKGSLGTNMAPLVAAIRGLGASRA